MKLKYLSLFICVALFWAGMIAGISFLEAPVKFTAPSLTLQVGLDVGRHVFGAFNKVEIVLGTLLVILAIITKMTPTINILTGIVVLLLILQCFWLLPVLDERAIAIISGKTPSGASPHAWYIIFDAIKLAGLISAAMSCFKKMRSGIAASSNSSIN